MSRLALVAPLALTLAACGGPPDPAADPAAFLSEAVCQSARQMEGVAALAVDADVYDAELTVDASGEVPAVTTVVTSDGPDLMADAYQFAAAGTLYGVMTVAGAPDVHPCDGRFPPDAFAHGGTEAVGGTIGHVIRAADGVAAFTIDPATYDLLSFETTSPQGTMDLEWGRHEAAGGVRYPRTVSVAFDLAGMEIGDDERAELELSLSAQDALAEMGELPDSLAGTRDALRAMLDGEPIVTTVEVLGVDATPAGS